jgi:hypothetical protein
MRLEVETPEELGALCGMPGHRRVRRLDLQVRRWHPSPELAGRFLSPEHLPSLTTLELSSDEPVPRPVMEAVALHRGLRMLSYLGAGLRDPQARWLAEGCPGLQVLRLVFADQLSREGYAALAQARFVPTLKQLQILFTLPRGALEVLAAGRWRQLQRLELRVSVGPDELNTWTQAVPRAVVRLLPPGDPNE